MNRVSTSSPRNRAIAGRVRSGETYAAIGTDYGISRERVRQIAAAFGARSACRGRPLVERVSWRCEVCGKEERRTPTRAKLKVCGKKCNGFRVGSLGLGQGRSDRTTPDGRSMFLVRGTWYVGSGPAGSLSTAARHIACLVLDRQLGRHEYATLIDGDPDNLDVSNIAITTAKQVARRRYGHPWTYTPLTDMRRNGGSA
jgi:hypothetical protein